ncbi:MAG: sensor domain-containing diguanylate cyclase, partial [Candidatus Omnitrophota bacterium]
TSHSGLGFNRAMLVLLDASGRTLEGKIGIGPDDGEEAKRVWSMIDEQKMDLDDLVNSYATSRQVLQKSRFFNQVNGFKVSVQEPDGGILSRVLHDGIPFHIKRENYGQFPEDSLLSIFASDEFVVAPIRGRDKSVGLIVADNIFTRRAITKDDIRLLTMFANQAAMAIENSQHYERTLARARKDSLTDLWNHGFFQYTLEERLRQAKNQVSYLSLILLDIDNFKNYNDCWGHQKGDEILVKISRLIIDSSRKIDFVCRYGGEEFAVILPDASRKDALQIAERIRTSIAEHDFVQTADHPPQKITVSIGLASFHEDGNNKAELLKAADLALYEAKHEGKNRVVTSS